MEIISLKLKSKNNPNVFEAETEHGVFLLHSDIIVKNGVAVGEFDSNLFYESVADSLFLIALNVAVKFVSNTVKTEKQIRDNLQKKGYDADTIKRVVDKLKEYKVVDDLQYAKMYVASNPSFSKLKLKQKLTSFGLKKQDIDALLNEKQDFEPCLKSAKKYIGTKPFDQKLKEKTIRHLMSQGYGYDCIRQVFNELKLSVEDEE